jgi:MFS family permease
MTAPAEASKPTRREAVAARRAATARPEPTYPDLSSRQILAILSGLLAAMFVSVLSMTILTTALPRISKALSASEAAYTWVIIASMLSMTASTPIWGKLSDRRDRKLLIQLALGLYAAASMVAGASQSMTMLIAARVAQGVGTGGIMSLSQIIMGSTIPPRERGRYGGYMGATFAAANVLGPLIGGLIVETPLLGWRGCFYVGLPFIAAAYVLIQRTLKVSHVPHRVPIDLGGGLLLTASVSILLIWISLAGAGQLRWFGPLGLGMAAAAAAGLAAALYVETQATDPVVPLAMFRERTVTLTVLATVLISCTMPGTSVFLSQYFQVGLGHSAAGAGVLTLPLVAGTALFSLGIGRMITATGRWKMYLVGGCVTLMVGAGVLSRMSGAASMAMIAAGMFLMGAGMGCLNQNMIIAVQNALPLSQIGSATSIVSFLRSLGSAAGIAALGAVLASRVLGSTADGFAHAGIAAPPSLAKGAIPSVNGLPADSAAIVRSAYSTSVGFVFLIMAIVIACAVLVLVLLRETPLKTRRDQLDAAAKAEAPDPAAPASVR